jgi:integrase
MPAGKPSQLHGLEIRHEQSCRKKKDESAGCNCRPSYRGRVRNGRTKMLRGPWTRNLSQARSWRVQTQAKLDAGETPERAKRTVADAAEAWLEGAKAGTIRNRKGKVYKPSTLRGIERLLEARVVPTFGRDKMSAVTRPRLQRWVRTLLEDGLSASTTRNTINALRVVFRQAVREGELSTHPCNGLELPAVDKHESRFVPAETVRAMLEALPIRDRAIWATAFYGGLRRGELWGLRCGNVDRGKGIIRVRNGEDAMDGRIEPKSAAGIRSVPIPGKLAEILMTTTPTCSLGSDTRWPRSTATSLVSA